jgi:hypothetical protein
MTKKDALQQYAELKIQIAHLEKQAEALKPKVLTVVEKSGGEDTPLGRFTLSSRKTWKYSEKVTKLVEKVKVAQVEEQEKGIAECTISNSLVFNAAKI